MKKRTPKTPREICRQFFGNPEPPANVWEAQFDFNMEELRKLTRKDWREIDARDLCIYLLDLCYVEPLQPDLFRYLFPICLAVWQECLMQGQSLEGEANSFFGILHRGNIFERMMTPKERQAVYDFMIDSMIHRFEQERGFIYMESRTPAYVWLYCFSHFGCHIPKIPEVWTRWWTFDHPGKAVSALMYASGLIYFDDENPIFHKWTPERGGGGPYLADIDENGWLEPNLAFLRNTLTADYLLAKIAEAAAVLQHEPEGKLAARLASNARERQDIIPFFIEDLLAELRTGFTE
jgi:hypothetical protein